MDCLTLEMIKKRQKIWNNDTKCEQTKREEARRGKGMTLRNKTVLNVKKTV